MIGQATQNGHQKLLCIPRKYGYWPHNNLEGNVMHTFRNPYTDEGEPSDLIIQPIDHSQLNHSQSPYSSSNSLIHSQLNYSPSPYFCEIWNMQVHPYFILSRKCKSKTYNFIIQFILNPSTIKTLHMACRKSTMQAQSSMQFN